MLCIFYAENNISGYLFAQHVSGLLPGDAVSAVDLSQQLCQNRV